MVPRLDNIAAYIKPSAMHWLDIDWDQQPELLFWTEELSPSAWGAKEYLFVIKVPTKAGSPIIMKAYHLADPEPSRGANEYRYVRFTPSPGGDGCVAAVFSYIQIGGSGSTYVNFEIGWNRYRNDVYIRRFFTAFPVAVGKDMPLGS